MSTSNGFGYHKWIWITRNAWQSLAYSPLGTTVSPLAGSSKTYPCYHLANVDILTRSLIDACSSQHYLVAMAMSLDKSENKVQIDHLHPNCFHMVKRLRKSVQYILRYSTKYASFLAVSCQTFTNELLTLELLDRISRNFYMIQRHHLRC